LLKWTHTSRSRCGCCPLSLATSHACVRAIATRKTCLRGARWFASWWRLTTCPARSGEWPTVTGCHQRLSPNRPAGFWSTASPARTRARPRSGSRADWVAPYPRRRAHLCARLGARRRGRAAPADGGSCGTGPLGPRHCVRRVAGRRPSRVDLVVGLDYPRWFSLQRVFRRSVMRATDKKPICNGNTESFRAMLGRDSIIGWQLRSFGRKRGRMRTWAAAAE
jgi:hypothetical protein